MNDQTKTIDQQGNEVLDPKKALSEPTLAVDLAGIEIDRLIATAHKFPRQIKVVMQQIGAMACHDEAAAENSVYALPRGGKAIVGPSIGFANIVASAWGNCWDLGRWVYTDRKEKVVVAEGIFIDWQTNRRVSMTEQRRVVDKHGRLYNDDTIIVTSKAAAQIARRNAILNAVPRSLWFPSYELALFMVRGTEAQLPDRRDKAIKALANFGIAPTRIFTYLGVKDIGEVGIEHMPTLRGMFSQLRDGSVSAEEMFDPRRMMGRGFDIIDNPLADGAEEPEAEEGDGAPGGDQAPGSAQPVGNPAAGQAKADPKPAAEKRAAPLPAERVTETAAAAGVAPAAQAGASAPPATTSAQAGSPSPAQADPAQSQAQPPKNPEEFHTYWEGFLDQATTLAAIQQQWSKDRDLRGSARVIGEHLDRAKKARQEREGEIKAEAGS